MSGGGIFDNAYFRTREFADDLDQLLNDPNRISGFEPATISKLHEIESLTRHTSKLMKEVEWLFEGDNGNDTFMKHVQIIETAHEAECKRIKEINQTEIDQDMLP